MPATISPAMKATISASAPLQCGPLRRAGRWMRVVVRHAARVNRRIGWHARHQRVAAALTLKHRAPQRAWIGRERVLVARRLQDPVVSLELGIELSRAPARVTYERAALPYPDRLLLALFRRSHHTDVVEGQQRGIAGILEVASTITDDGWTGPPMNSCSSRSTRGSSCGTDSPTVVSEGRLRTSPKRAVVGVLHHEHDRAPEVGVKQGGPGDQENTLAPSPSVPGLGQALARGLGQASASSRSARCRPDEERLAGVVDLLQVQLGELGDHLEEIDPYAHVQVSVGICALGVVERPVAPHHDLHACACLNRDSHSAPWRPAPRGRPRHRVQTPKPDGSWRNSRSSPHHGPDQLELQPNLILLRVEERSGVMS